DPAAAHFFALSLHDALPIFIWRPSPAATSTSSTPSAPTPGWPRRPRSRPRTPSRRNTMTKKTEFARSFVPELEIRSVAKGGDGRSEEHTSELQSRENLVCRL